MIFYIMHWLDKLNQYNLYNAQTYVQQTLGGSIFAVEAWVPLLKSKVWKN